MKKYFLNIIMFIILIIVLFGLTGCNNSSNNNSKGSRSNPYKIGEQIKIDEIYGIYDLEDIERPFKLTFIVNEIYDEKQGVELKEEKGASEYSSIPIANISFEVSGDYEDEIKESSVFQVSYINNSMEKQRYVLENKKQESIGSFYTGNQYNAIVLGKYDYKNKEADIPKYIVIDYWDKFDKCNTIYIDVMKKSIEDNDSKTQNNNEDLYQSAIELINNKEYDEAKDILKEILDYKDSKEYTSYCIGMHYYNFKMYGKAINNFNKCDNILDARKLKEELLNIVSKYNGTYYYQYPGNDFLGYYLFIKDGKADIYSKSLYNDGDSIYYNYSINSKYNNSLNKDELYIGSTIFEKEPDSKNYEFLFYELPDGGIAVSSQEGSVNTMYSGVYDKISDSVPPEK